MRFTVISKKCLSSVVLTGAAVLVGGCSETASTPGKSPLGPPKSTAHVSSTTGLSKGREVPEAAPVSDDASKPARETAEDKPAGE